MNEIFVFRYTEVTEKLKLHEKYFSSMQEVHIAAILSILAQCPDGLDKNELDLLSGELINTHLIKLTPLSEELRKVAESVGAV